MQEKKQRSCIVKEETSKEMIRGKFIQAAPILKLIILFLIGILAFLVRIFSVIRYESVIHEYDPWFNYRTT